MLFSYNWIKEYCPDIPPPEIVRDRLTMTGTEVESMTGSSNELKGVVIAEVLSSTKHPNADKLGVCEVNTGKETLSIVCGATNMKPGDRVALAMHGAVLPNGLKIKRSKIRGVESNGMMCSEKELGLKETSDGIMILPKDAPLGADVAPALCLGDVTFEAAITPNRADLLSIRGIAREIAAITGAGFADKRADVEETGGPVNDRVKAGLEFNAGCRRYSVRVIEGVNVAPSPDFIVKRLVAHGLRPINNVVDITNYVLLETGQPLHAFDLDRLEGKTINIRRSKKGESIETLDNKRRPLETGTLVIADGKGPVAIAGVMGGKGTEVLGSTKNIMIESAFFDAGEVRRSSKASGLSTDSSYRFERGVDINGVPHALDMATALMRKYAGGTIAKGVIDIYPELLKPEPITFRVRKASELLGVNLNDDEVMEGFRRLGMDITESVRGSVVTIAPPSFRKDINTETDLVEEAARLFGYDKIPATVPFATLKRAKKGRFDDVRTRINHVLVTAGFYEAINYCFVPDDLFTLTGEAARGVRIRNPLSEEQSVMRGSIVPSLLSNLKANLARQNEEVRLFEVGPVFSDRSESWKVAGLIYGRRYGTPWNTPKDESDFFDIKGVVESVIGASDNGLSNAKFEKLDVKDYNIILHPARSASTYMNGKLVGVLGEVHPDCLERFDLPRPAYVFELDMEALSCPGNEPRKYQRVERFPTSQRDVAFMVSENMQYGEILNAIEQLDEKLVEKVELFDVYCGQSVPKGKVSMAIRITYRSPERTLRQAEVDELHSRVAGVLATGFGAKIRVG